MITSTTQSTMNRLGLFVAALALGFMLVTPLIAAENNSRDLFQVKAIDSLLKKITGGAAVSATDKIVILSPQIAESGKEVSIAVRSEGLKYVESITLMAEKNTNPMLASFKMSERSKPFIRSRVKLSKTTRVLALVKADGKYYTASTVVKVTDGGCGGG